MITQPRSDARPFPLIAQLKRLTLLAALVPAGAAALLAAGCEKKPAPAAAAGAAVAPAAGNIAVAVINLDQVGRSVGWQGVLEKNLQSTEDDLKRQLDSYFRNDLQAAIEAKFKQVSTAARLTPDQSDKLTKGLEWDKLPITKEQRDELLLVSGNARQIVQAANQQANQIMQNRRAELVNTYRDALKPIVRRVAQNNGVNLVLTHPVDSVFYFDAAVDITDKVVDEVQKQNPTPTFRDAPKPNLPRIDLTATAPPATAPATTKPAK